MSFFIYDIIFLIIFTLFVVFFLYKRKNNLKREMKIAFLYRTKFGIKFIDYIGKKYKKTIFFLRYLVIAIGYFLMAIVVYFLGQLVYSYVRYPQITQLIKAPPIAPVIPYFPKLFGLESFFPPFYFTYFLLGILIVATVHEFSHGIFAKAHNLKIKSTGFAFFGPLIGAFVEPDEKAMLKKPKIAQMSILGAGVFANIIVAIIFFFIWWGMFSATFVPVGATFDGYSSAIINITGISMIDGIQVENPTRENILNIIDNNELTTDVNLEIDGDILALTSLKVGEEDFLTSVDILKEDLEKGELTAAYYDFPAINEGLRGDIIEVNDLEIKTHRDLREVLNGKKPGEEINIKTNHEGEVLEYNLVLKEDPNQEGRGVLGIGNNLIGRMKVEDRFAFFKEPFTEYEGEHDFLEFIYYLVFWIFLLNLLVAFFNMLPFAIFDGGRFFYLTILGITRSKKVARKVFRGVGIIILFAFILLMITWLVRVI